MKFVRHEYNKETGETFVWLDHKGHSFCGDAKLHPDDKEYESELAGGLYAESRAMIQALKYDYNVAKAEAEVIRKFIKACECYKNFDKESPTAKAMYRQFNRRVKIVNQIADNINAIWSSLIKAMHDRDAYIKRENEKKDKEN